MSRFLKPQAAYDAWAPTYDSDHNPMVAMVDAVLARQRGPAPWRVVELGCGTGRNLATLAGRGCLQLMGADLSEEMLAVAARRVPHARLLRQDICQPLPLMDGAADLVLVSLVLEHIDDPTPVFAEAARLLADDGELIVLELHPDAFDAGSRAGFADSEGEEQVTAACRHDADELDRLARAAGLALQKFESLRPDAELLERFPRLTRRADVHRLLVGRWRRSRHGPNTTTLDRATWHRRVLFDFFRDFEDPFYNVCADVALADTYGWCRRHGVGFHLACVHAVMRAVHAVPELRTRLRGDDVVMHRRLWAGNTVLHHNETFGYAYYPYQPHLRSFVEDAQQVLDAVVRAGPGLTPDDRSDVIHLSSVPWIRFRSVSHARSHRAGLSVPKVVLGRRHDQDMTLPVSIEVHHGLVDGLHVGRFFEFLQRAFEELSATEGETTTAGR